MKKILFNKRNYIRNYYDLIQWFLNMEPYFSQATMARVDFLFHALSLPPKEFESISMRNKIINYTAALERSQSKFFHPDWPSSHFSFVFDLFY